MTKKLAGTPRMSNKSQKLQDSPLGPSKSPSSNEGKVGKRENSSPKTKGPSKKNEEFFDGNDESLDKNDTSSDENDKSSDENNKSLDTKDDKNGNTCNWVFFVICIIPILFSLMTYFPWTKQSPQTVDSSTNSQVHPVENFRKEFKDLKSKFIAQDPDFWKRIKVPVLRVIKDDIPEYPAIVLLVVPKGESNSKTATCLAKRYRSIINKIYTGREEPENGYINVQKMQVEKPVGSIEDVKYALDNKIKNLFNNTKPEVHTVVIDHIETLDPNVMLLFHGYCDGDHAPYKKAMFVFVLHTDLETSKASENLDRIVDEYLTALWEKNLDKDKILPLISRVANNKALVNEENISSLTKSGC